MRPGTENAKQPPFCHDFYYAPRMNLHKGEAALFAGKYPRQRSRIRRLSSGGQAFHGGAQPAGR